jgi:hypothetical protein
MARNMARKKARTIDSDTALTRIFLALLILSGLAGILGQFARLAGAD